MLPTGPARSTATEEDDSDFETYLLLLLSDSNLPTGGFVASSGLESFHAHGLLHSPGPSVGSSSNASSSTSKRPLAPSQAQLSSSTLSFARSTLHSYARSSFPFLARVHTVVSSHLDEGARAHSERSQTRLNESAEGSEVAEELAQDEERLRLEACLNSISKSDHSYHTLVLNHVARRASKAQGIALLTLYSKAFAKPIDLEGQACDGTSLGNGTSNASSERNGSSHALDNGRAKRTKEDEQSRIELAAQLVDRLKMDIRKSSTRLSNPPGTTPKSQRGLTWTELGGQHGHLPICWAVFSACLGISFRKAIFLHLFLQARSLFSSSIRLNTLGPYLAHQIMRFQMRGVVDGIIVELEREGCLDAGTHSASQESPKVQKRKKEREEEQMDMEDVEAYTINDQHVEATTKPSTEHPTSLPVPAPTLKPFRTTSTMSSVSYDLTTSRSKGQSLRTGKGRIIPVDDDDTTQGWAWDWPEEQHLLTEREGKDSETGFWTSASAPATTFPLGEIIQARHDQLHSRLFNS